MIVTKQPTKTKGFNTNNQKCKTVIYENQERKRKKETGTNEQMNTDILDPL